MAVLLDNHAAVYFFAISFFEAAVAPVSCGSGFSFFSFYISASALKIFRSTPQA